jgi:hypothetical protein
MLVVRPILWKGTRFALLLLGALATLKGGIVQPVQAQCAKWVCVKTPTTWVCDLTGSHLVAQCIATKTSCIVAPPCP